MYEVVIHQVPQVLFFAFVAFFATSSYKGVVRHTGFKDVVNVFKAMALYTVLILAFNFFLYKIDVNPVYRIGQINIWFHVLVNFIALVLLRVLYKWLYNFYISTNQKKSRVMIYGAGDSGTITARVLQNDEQSKVYILGFIDDNKKKSGKYINGIKVYSPETITPAFLEKQRVSEIIISIQNIKKERLREIVDQFTNAPVSLKIVPAISQWLGGDLTAQQIKNIKIEDLLGRQEIELDKESIQLEVKGKILMVTGAAGSIGSEIVSQLLNYNPTEIILVDQSESALFDLQQSHINNAKASCSYVVADVRNEERMELIMQKYQPDILFHAAAYKHVPMMELNPYEAVMTNIKGTITMANLAMKYKVKKFVLVSTDKAVNPTNVMGASKRIAELYVTYLNGLTDTRFIVTRFGNVLGSNGSVIPVFKKQLEKGGPLTVTHHEISRYFMTIPEACQLVLEAAAMGKGGEVFVFDMGEAVRIFDLAKKIIQLSGLKYPTDINIEIIGLRPGEKIHEELLANDESSIKTHHPKIMIAKVVKCTPELHLKITKLVEINERQNTEDYNLILVRKLKEIVPEFVSNNSVYSAIDVNKNK